MSERAAGASAPPAGGADAAWLDFYGAWSTHVDAFLARRSVLTSALFPEKPAQMWFGYGFTAESLDAVADWLDARTTPDEYARGLRRLAAPANGLHLMGLTFAYALGAVGRLVEGLPFEPARAVRTLDWWRHALAAYCAPAGWRELLRPDGTAVGHRVLAAGPAGGAAAGSAAAAERADAAASLAARMRPPADAGVDPQRVVGALTSWSWLLEAESRQGVFNHGPYPTAAGTQLLVRELGDLSGSFYDWVEADALGVAPGPVALALELDADVSLAFDAFGVVKLEPEAYGGAVRGVAVETADGPVADGAAWLREVGERVGPAHRALYRTVAGWGARERFTAGARSYARMWAALVTAGGGDDADRERLVLAPLSRALGEPLERQLAALAAGDEPGLWRWVRERGDETLLAPLLDATGAATPARQAKRPG